MKARIISAALILAGALAALSCEKYEKVPENSAFSIDATVAASSASSPVSVLLTVTDGNSEGDYTLETSVRNASGAEPEYSVLLNGSATIGASSVWQFEEDGSARFTLEGLPAGSYSATFTVRRWYHSATTSVTFIVNQ